MNIYYYISCAFAFVGHLVGNVSNNPIAIKVVYGCVIAAAVSMLLAAIKNVRTETSEVYNVDRERQPRQTRANESERPYMQPRQVEPTPTPSPYGVGEISQPIAPEHGNPLAGMSFALTGKMPVKRAKMECLIAYFGGTIHKRIRKDTTYLVVGDSREVSDKESKASEWNTPTLTVEDLAKMCGITYYDIRDHYFDVVPKEVVGEQLMSESKQREVSQYDRVAMNQRTLLMELMQVRQEIALAEAMPIVVGKDEEMELAKVVRLQYRANVGDYILFSADGEAIYLDDVRDCSVSDLLRNVA